MIEKLFNIKGNLTASQVIVLGFMGIILTGGVILTLPVSSANGTWTNFVDALFTSTTSVCVTGLVTVPTFSHWSIFGKVVILFLIQFGGLGFMTCFTCILIVLRKRITLKERMVIQNSLNENTLSGLVKLVQRIIKGTAIVEGIGAVLYCFAFVPKYGFVRGVANSIFTSISAFCNAGIDIMGVDSLVPMQRNVIVNFVTMGLIIAGGIGFTVWWDILKHTREAKKNKWGFKKNFTKLTLHSKLVLAITINLILIGAVFFFIAEFNNPDTMGNLNLFEKMQASLFQAVTTRTAGFMTVDQGELSLSSQFMSVILMFVGGSPAGTAGGIKTTTFGIIILAVISVIKGREHTQVFNRTIPETIISRAVGIMSISLFFLVAGTMLLSVTEGIKTLMPILYEVVSALATVGLSVGITAHLTVMGKLLIIVLMFVGRIGPISMAIAFAVKRKKANSCIKHPEENVMVG